MKLSVVLPAYNEEANLPRTLRELIPILRRETDEFEVLIVNDGSVDNTAVVAESLAREDTRIHVLHHAINHGYGAALRTGFAAARLDWCFLMDSDGQFDPGELPVFLRETEHAQLIAGYRTMRADPFHRALYARMWRGLMRLFLGLRVRDVNCAFKVISTTLIKSLDLEAQGAFVSAELLAKAQRAGARLIEIPIRHRPRLTGKPTGSSPRVLLLAFEELVRLRKRIGHFSPVAMEREPSGSLDFSAALERTADGHE